MKKAIAIVLSMMLLFTLASGCSKKQDTPEDNVVEQNEETEKPEEKSEESEEEDGEPKEISGEFTWWTYFDQAPYLKEQFETEYPDVEIKLETFGGDQYETKLMTTLQSGQDIPDLFDLEEGYVYKFIESDLLADLGTMGGEELVEDYYPWAVEMGKDSNGTLKGICDNVSPVAFWYTRDAMEEWLGTSDPDEIAEKLSDWDKIIEVAKDVKEKSGGEVYLWPNLSEIVKVEGYSITPFVRDGKFEMAPEWKDVMKLMRTFYEEELIADLGSWGQEWATEWNKGNLLIRVMPSWDFFADWEKNAGNVGVAKPLKGSYEGGTYRAIYSKSENQELCMEFLSFLTTPEYQIDNLNDNNQMPANMKVFEEIGSDYEAENFGGQNILKTYDEICRDISSIRPDKYTRDVQNTFGKHCEEGIKNGLSDEEIIENFKKEVKDKYPEIKDL